MTNPPSPGALIMHPAGPEIDAHVSGFVHRDEFEGGTVVRVLPELRPSIQIMIADPYWLRERGADASWSRLPRIALWAPRFEWCYGYAAGHIKAYALGLTAAGFSALTGRSARQLVNNVFALDQFSPPLSRALAPIASEAFEDWSARVSGVLREFFETKPRPAINLDDAVSVLATSESGAVERAAQLSGLSERQFRRVFEKFYGVTPKRYQRALRVDRMIRQLHPAPWEKDAYADDPVAFADQPHAIREFQALIGMTPRQYMRRKQNADRTLRSVAEAGIAPPRDAAE